MCGNPGILGLISQERGDQEKSVEIFHLVFLQAASATSIRQDF